MEYEDLITLGISLGLGMLVGLQREHTHHKVAGVRTFTLIAVLGSMAGFLSRDLNNAFILPAFGLALAIMVFLGQKEEKERDGKTTEVAVLLMFAIGAYIVLGSRLLGVVAGGVLAVLLYAKTHLHGFIGRLKDSDVSAIMTFAGISLIILPILPNETYGPYDVINPQNIWLMVVLIVGLSLAGYFLYKFFGKNSSIILGSILGGFISSTATTVTYSRRQKKMTGGAKVAAFIITTASSIALIRILIETSVVIPRQFPKMVLPILFNFLTMAVICVWLFYLLKTDKKEEGLPEPENPAQFSTALTFGFLYALILLLVAFAQDEFGNRGLVIVSIISGLTDVDAITLSLSQMIKDDNLNVDKGWRLILLASLSNLFFKGILASLIGTGRLTKWLSISFGIAILVGLLTIWLWPQNWQF